jgi:hypothetical protein
MAAWTFTAQVDDTGKSALDYAREAKQHSTWLMLSQSQQEHLAKSKVQLLQLCFAGCDVAIVLQWCSS